MERVVTDSLSSQWLFVWLLGVFAAIRLGGGLALDPHESNGSRSTHIALFVPTSVILTLPNGSG